MHCANVLCNNKLPAYEFRTKLHSRWNLCSRCVEIVSQKGVPLAGFIPIDAVNAIARAELKDAAPTNAEIADAKRFARGRSYPYGPWEQRPAYRMAVLKYAKGQRRMHHLLLGRARPPSAMHVTATVVHYHLAKGIMDMGHRYAIYLAGASFFAQQGMIAPPGRKSEVALGGCKYSKWHLNYSDYSMLGAHALQAAKRLGINYLSSELKASIVAAYYLGLQEGRFKQPISVPLYSMRTSFLNDHALTHQYGPRADVPRKYFKAVRTSSGLIKGTWPEGRDPRSHLLPRPAAPPKPAPLPPPSTDWIFK